MTPSEETSDDQRRRDQRERETKAAIDLALRRRKVDDHLHDLDEAVKDIKDDYRNILRKLTEALERLTNLENRQITDAAVAKAVSDKSISTRSFFLGCAGVVASLGAILAGTGHT